MKKIFIILLCVLLVTLPLNVFAEEYNKNDISNTIAINAKGTNTNKKETTKNSSSTNEKKKNSNTSTNSSSECELLFGERTGKKIRSIYKLMRFAVPILLLVLSVKDFGMVVITQDSDIKKATSTFFKRIVVAIIILVLPTIVGFILDAMGIDKCI